MPAVNIDVDTKELSAFIDAAPTKTGLAILRAVKRGTTSARTHGARVVSKDMGLKVGSVRKRIILKAPTGQTLTGEVRANLKRIPLVEFGVSGPEPSGGKGRGVKRRGGSRLPHAFISTMPTGHRGVFKRKTESRLPIRELFGPSVGRVFDLHRDEIMAKGEEVALAELDRQLDRMFGVSDA